MGIGRDPIGIGQEPHRLTLCSEAAGTTLYTEEPVLCVCERFSTVFINSEGHTYCAWCLPLPRPARDRTTDVRDGAPTPTHTPEAL